MSSIFISLEGQQSYFTVLRLIFSISMALHVISLIFLLKFTPPNQTGWRKYMLFIQVSLIAMDIYMEILFVPMPLFPSPCGYCTGLLCRLNVPVQAQTGIGFLLIGFLNVSVILCIFHRHQSLLIGASRFKLEAASNRIFLVLLLIAFSLPPIFFLCVLQDPKVVEDALNKDSRNLTWVKERGCYTYLKKEPVHYIFGAGVALLMIIFSTALPLMFSHMKYVLKSETSIRSRQSTINIRKSVVRLFIQLVTPYSLFGIPSSLMMVGLAADGFLSFEQSLGIFTIILLHPIAHNVLLITLTPSFRAKIGNFLISTCSCSRQPRTEPSVSIIHHKETLNNHRTVWNK